jgi:hypothetical protein
MPRFLVACLPGKSGKKSLFGTKKGIFLPGNLSYPIDRRYVERQNPIRY